MDPKTPRTLTCLPAASRDLILTISTDLTERMNRLILSGRIAAVDVIPIAKDILDLSTLRCLVEEKRLKRYHARQQSQRGRSGSVITIGAAPTWEEMDDHVCASTRTIKVEGGLNCRERRRERKERRALRRFMRRGGGHEQAVDEVLVECRCSRALELMDLEGDILRSFPDDSGDTLVAPELAQWAIGHLQVEAEQTRELVESLLWVTDDEEGSESLSVSSPRVDSMEPEGSPLSQSPATVKSGKTTAGKGATSSPKRVRGWWKSDVDDEGDLEVEDDVVKGENPDRGSGQVYPIHLCQRKRSRVFSALRKFSLA